MNTKLKRLRALEEDPTEVLTFDEALVEARNAFSDLLDVAEAFVDGRVALREGRVNTEALAKAVVALARLESTT